MARVDANGIQIEYETCGESSQPPLLLIMGLSRQLIHWPDAFCEALAERGHYVIRFDNRDVGLSTKCDHLGEADVAGAMAGLQGGAPVTPPYTIHDMAADTVGLLDALDIPSAHICGVSMGGMVAQCVALEFPKRVRSLTCLMSGPGDQTLVQPTPEAMAVLMATPAESRDEFIEQKVRETAVLNGDLPVDEEWIRDVSARAYDRCRHPAGVARQYAAILCAENRAPALASLQIPTLVMHGRADPLVPFAHGEATAAAIPGATLIAVDGWGHSLPSAVWPDLLDAITAHTAAAESGVAT